MILLCSSEVSSLSQAVARELGCKTFPVCVKTFVDGEKQVCLPLSVQNEAVLLFPNATLSSDEAIFEVLQMVDAARRSGAKSITCVWPCYPYARQDKAVKSGCSVPPQLVSKLLAAAGANQVVTVDIHAPEQLTAFVVPTFNVPTEKLFLAYLRTKRTDRMMLLAADKSVKTRVQSLAEALACDCGWADKEHRSDGTLTLANFQGQVLGNDVYVIDDRIDSGATMALVAKYVKQFGAQRMVGMVTHGVCSMEILKRLKQAGMNSLVETDTRPVKNVKDFTTIFSVAHELSTFIENHKIRQ